MELHRVFSVFNRCDGGLVCNRICNRKGVCAMKKTEQGYLMFLSMSTLYFVELTRTEYGLSSHLEQVTVILAMLVALYFIIRGFKND